MTKTVSQTVTQADREAAALMFRLASGWENLPVSAAEKRIRDGKADSSPFVTAFAHHAEQARLEERERAAKVCDTISNDWQRRAGEATTAPRTEMCNEIAISHRLNATVIRKGEG